MNQYMQYMHTALERATRPRQAPATVGCRFQELASVLAKRRHRKDKRQAVQAATKSYAKYTRHLFLLQVQSGRRKPSLHPSYPLVAACSTGRGCEEVRCLDLDKTCPASSYETVFVKRIVQVRQEQSDVVGEIRSWTGSPDIEAPSSHHKAVHHVS